MLVPTKGNFRDTEQEEKVSVKRFMEKVKSGDENKA